MCSVIYLPVVKVITVERVDKIQQPLLKQMASEPVQRDSYRQHLYITVLVKRTRLHVRNEEVEF